MTLQGARLAIVTLAVTAVCLGGTRAVEGQTRDEGDRPPSGATVMGDTGLWFVPTAEVLPRGHWSLSSFRANTDRQQGFTDISHFVGGGSIGVFNRLELFGSLNVRTRIDRDLRPLSRSDVPNVGGLDGDYPFVRDGFTHGFGDLSLGAKLNLRSESRGHPLALAVRGLAKLPTGEKDKGVSTGETDVIVDVVASRHLGSVEVSAFGGGIVRGDAPEADLPNGVRWGVGAGFPAPARLRVITEIRGEVALDDEVVARSPLIARDGSVAPLRSLMRNPVDTLFGLTWQGPGGVSVGAGVSWAARFSSRERFSAPAVSEVGDRFGFQFGIGLRPGRRAPVLPPPADVPTPRSSLAPAPSAERAIERPAADPTPVQYVFEDVHFDFDRFTLRPGALRVLDEAAQAMQATPGLRLTIDGHTCNIGTAEYNIALADRRAKAVREYLIGRGIEPGRLIAVAYGEERPGHDNDREETRRLNRRAALVVELGAVSQND